MRAEPRFASLPAELKSSLTAAAAADVAAIGVDGVKSCCSFYGVAILSAMAAGGGETEGGRERT